MGHWIESHSMISSVNSKDEVEIDFWRIKRVIFVKEYGPDYETYIVEEDLANLHDALSSLDVKFGK